MSDAYLNMRKNVLEPIFWGFMVALISLPFYLALSFPEVGISIGSHSMEVGMVHVFAIPALAAFLASAVLGEREMRSGLIMVVSAAMFLTVLIVFILLLPRMIGAVYLIDFYYIGIGKKMIVAILVFFPSLLVGGMIGSIFGDTYVSDTSRSERKKLNEEMREWKKTLERAIMESEKGNTGEIHEIHAKTEKERLSKGESHED